MKWINLYTILLTILFNSPLLLAQQAIDITEQTIKLNKKEEKELSYAFAEGDKIIFSLDVLDSEQLDLVAVTEYPNDVKYTEYKLNRLNEKVFIANKKGVYIFKLKNGKKKTTSRVRIQRIPKSPATAHFNTNVRWVEKYDTTYTDTIITTKTKVTTNNIIKTEYVEEILIDRIERIQGFFNMSEENRRYFKVQLPQDEISTIKSKKLKSWAYWLANSTEADAAWAKNVRTVSNVGKVAINFSGPYGPLAFYAIGLISELAIPKAGDDVEYYFMHDQNAANAFYNKQHRFNYFDKGRGPGGYAKHSASSNRSFYIGLANDNMVKDIDIKIKISIIWEVEYYGKSKKKGKEQIRIQSKTYRKPHIQKIKVPIY